MEGHRDLAAPLAALVGGKLWEAVEYHRSMLSDGVRNRAFATAVERTVEPGMTVLDIGAGTGPWTILAAQRGARVTAVEKNPVLVPILRQLVADNGVADRVTIVEGDSRTIELGGARFDLLISETIGSNAFDEDIVPIFTDARRRFLRDGAGVVLRRLSLCAAPVHLDERLPVGVGLPLALGSFVGLLQQFPTPLAADARLTRLAAAATLTMCDLRTAEALPELAALSARFNDVEGPRLSGVVIWFVAELCDGVELSSWDCPSWSKLLFPLEPFTGRGVLEFAHDRRPTTFGWSATFDGGGEAQAQAASPHLGRAWLEVTARRGG